MISPSAAALSSLRTHGLDDDLIRVATTMAEEIHAAADDVASDTRSAAYDDSTSRGQLLYRRARNRIVARFEQDLAISCDTTDNALHIRYRQTAFSFYSAREGLERPSVYGSRTKRRVVDESQMTLDVGDEIELRRLVLMHEAADDGLVRLGVGVLASSTEWSWNIRLYDRYAMPRSTISVSPTTSFPSPSFPSSPHVSASAAITPPNDARRLRRASFDACSVGQ